MIGKIMSEVSHSITGMLSAKPADMETHASNFDFNSLLTSSDEQYAAVLGEKGIKLPSTESGMRFADQIADAGFHVQTETICSDETDVVSEEKTAVAELDISNDVVSSQSGLVTAPSLPKASTSEELRLSSQTNVNNSVSEDVEIGAEPLAQPFRKPANFNFGPREERFAVPVTLTDNFAAIESAIARYAIRADEVDGSQDQILPTMTQDKDSELVSPTRTIPEIQKPSKLLTKPDQKMDPMARAAGSKKAVGLNRPTYALQQHVTLDQMQVPQTDLTVAPQSMASLKPININDHIENKVDLTRNPAPVAPIDTSKLSANSIEMSDSSRAQKGFVALRPAPLANDKSAQVQRFDDLTPEAPKYEEKLMVTPAIKQSSGRPSLSIPLANMSTDLFGKTAENSQSKIDLPVSHSVNQMERPSGTFSPKADMAKPVRSEAEPKAIPANIQAASATDLNKSAQRNRSTIEPLVNQEVTVPTSSSNRAIDEDFLRSLRDGPSRVPVSNFPSESGKPARESQILDSIDLRLASKLDAKRPVATTSQEMGIAKSEVVDENQTIEDKMVPSSPADKHIPVTPSSHLPNPVAAPAVQKPVQFDWHSPQFAERFATEIKDFSVDGDLKKFEINPRNLGRLEVAFVARGSSEFIRIEAESQAARDVIVQHSQAIQDMLKAQGRSDLSIRIDIKDNAFASSSDSNNLNFSQQDQAGAREDRSGGQPNSGSMLSSEGATEPEIEGDKGRYA